MHIKEGRIIRTSTVFGRINCCFILFEYLWCLRKLNSWGSYLYSSSCYQNYLLFFTFIVIVALRKKENINYRYFYFSPRSMPRGCRKLCCNLMPELLRWRAACPTLWSILWCRELCTPRGYEITECRQVDLRGCAVFRNIAFSVRCLRPFIDRIVLNMSMDINAGFNGCKTRLIKQK